MKRVALAIIRNEAGEFLLQHKDQSAPTNPNMWCLFGGAVEPGETPEDAIKREIREELLEELPVTEPAAHVPDPRNGIERFYFFADWTLPIERLRAQLQEGDDVGYFRAELLQDLVINAAHAAVISALNAS